MKDALEEGYVNSSSSLEVLRQMRQELGVSEEEHLQAITELGIEDPDLFDPSQQRNRENQSRLQGFRQQIRSLVSNKRRRGATGLGKDLLKVVKKQKSIHTVLPKDGLDWRFLSQEYGVTAEEEAKILADLDPELKLVRRTEILTNQLQQLATGYQTLESVKVSFNNSPQLVTALGLLQTSINRKQELIIKGTLELLQNLDSSPELTRIVLTIASLAPKAVLKLLHDRQAKWQEKLNTTIWQRLENQAYFCQSLSLEAVNIDCLSYLETFFYEADSLSKAVSLYVLDYLDREKGQQQARQLINSHLILNPLVRETAKNILDGTTNDDNTLDKLLYLAANDIFSNLKTDHLIDIAYQAKIKRYHGQEIILEQGAFNQEFFLLIRGQVATVDRQEIFTPICLLNEVEILAEILQNHTLISQTEATTIISIDRNWFEDLFALDRDFARQVLGRETSKRLQSTFN